MSSPAQPTPTNQTDPFEVQNVLAEKILTARRGEILAIRKATCAGATHSLIKKACELRQKTVIVMPYKIGFKTVKKALNTEGAKGLAVQLSLGLE